jgi:NAD(P)-dependent dehydrogenase (short-subunit alcohol dehydrogenase family)
MDLGLAGRVAAVTGGSSGIGLAIAAALATEGADVVIGARGVNKLHAAADELDRRGPGRIMAHAIDTATDDSVRSFFDDVRRLIGDPQILVNGAATPSTGTLGEERLEAEINVKVRGYLRCARAVAPAMAASGWGRIINIGGTAARRSGSVVGSIRNVAVTALSKNLADELGQTGINVTSVHPALTYTEGTAARVQAAAQAQGTSEEAILQDMSSGSSIGRLVTAEEVAWVVAFLASPRSVSINGDSVYVGGGTLGAIYY